MTGGDPDVTQNPFQGTQPQVFRDPDCGSESIEDLSSGSGDVDHSERGIQADHRQPGESCHKMKAASKGASAPSRVVSQIPEFRVELLPKLVGRVVERPTQVQGQFGEGIRDGTHRGMVEPLTAISLMRLASSRCCRTPCRSVKVFIARTAKAQREIRAKTSSGDRETLPHRSDHLTTQFEN
jgi:hypothetical protein